MLSSRVASRKAVSLCNPIKYFAGKQLIFGTAARKRMLEGCVNLAEAVAVTLGPGG
jgi:hypothetical protein